MVCNWDIKVFFFFFSPALQMQKVFLKNNFWSVWKSSPESLLSARKCAPHKASPRKTRTRSPGLQGLKLKNSLLRNLLLQLLLEEISQVANRKKWRTMFRSKSFNLSWFFPQSRAQENLPLPLHCGFRKKYWFSSSGVWYTRTCTVSSLPYVPSPDFQAFW